MVRKAITGAWMRYELIYIAPGVYFPLWVEPTEEEREQQYRDEQERDAHLPRVSEVPDPSIFY